MTSKPDFVGWLLNNTYPSPDTSDKFSICLFCTKPCTEKNHNFITNKYGSSAICPSCHIPALILGRDRYLYGIKIGEILKYHKSRFLDWLRTKPPSTRICVCIIYGSNPRMIVVTTPDKFTPFSNISKAKIEVCRGLPYLSYI